MVKLNSFRLVNVRANNNTIIYPDVTFNLDGKSTLIDAKNGGGKTLAIQMLFQTILPKSSFDDNKTIFTLFDNVPPKTTMHSISSFKLNDDYPFNTLCLGFAVSKSQDITAEYTILNYVIEGDNLEDYSLSIDTIALSSNNRVLSIGELKSLLTNKMTLKKSTFKITIFENNVDEYTEFLHRYDINSQVFKFIMSINQTENYIQQYFEKNCNTQQGLLTEFIIPNTISVLDEKKSSNENSTQEDISILAQSLLEKSKSLNELKTIENDLGEYQKIIAMIDSFLFVVKSNRHNFTKYDKFLKEYSKQYSSYSYDVKNIERQLNQISTDIEITKSTLQELDDTFEYLTTRKFECDVLDTQSTLNKAEECYSKCSNDILELQSKYNNMIATNSIVEYKNIENTLKNLSDDNTQVGDISKYANTIYDISTKQIAKNNYEIEYTKKMLKQLNLQLEEYSQNIGKSKQLNDISQKNIRDFTEELNNQLVQMETIKNKLSGFKRYSNSLLENEELFSIIDSIKELTSKIKSLSDTKTELETKISIEENEIKHITKDIEQYSILVDYYSNKKSNYEDEVASLKSELNVEEFEFESKYNQFLDRKKEIIKAIDRISQEILSYKEDISIIKKHGLLREKTRYEALETLQSELETACFGLDVIQNNFKILEKFPSLAETVIVSDKDYNNIKNGNIKLPNEVTKENFLIMPYTTIRNINKLSFSDMFLLTRDSQYYKSIIDNNATIESYNQKILANKYKIEKLNTEYDTIQSLCNRIIVHVGKYSFDIVQEINTSLQENQNSLKALQEELKLKNSTLSQDKSLLDTYIIQLEDLSSKLSNAEDKKVLLNELIKLISESHKNQITINSEKKKLLNYQADIKDLELQLASIKSKISSLQSDYNYQINSVGMYENYILEVEDYIDQSGRGVNSKNLDLLIQKFRMLKDGYTHTQLDIIKPILISLMDNIKKREIFQIIDFNEIYSQNRSLVPFDDVNLEMCKSNLEDAYNTLKEQSNFLVAQNNSLEIYVSNFDSRLNAEDSQYYDYRKYSIDEVQILLNDNNIQREQLNEKLRILLEKQSNLKDTYNEYLLESELYKSFCVENHLDTNLKYENITKVKFSDMSSKFKEISNNYNYSLNEVNNSIKKLSNAVDDLKISEQIKYTIKNNAIPKQSFIEVTAFTDRIKILKSQAEAMTNNLKTTVQNIGRIDDDITQQLYRILTEILDEVSAIPKISKFKVGDTYKETFKINLYEGGKGCRLSEERIKNSIRKYIIDLANGISSQYYDKNKVIELLSLDKIIRFGIDMNRLNIQILKIDQERLVYQNWENIVASTGQEYIMYVLFTITMIKYFNNVVSNDNKTPIFIFLDNPFASASDLQLWQPVKKFLDKNDAQLLCLSHNVPAVSQILFERQIILEQFKSEDGMIINSIRNEKTELKENIQLTLL
ncbi:MAG: hypothetical protein ACI4WH_05835 [Oscillospiraceae bacterium]